MKNIVLILITLSVSVGIGNCQNGRNPTAEIIIDEVEFSYSELKGLGSEIGVCRRDPSDIILVDGIYYVWYTRTEKQYSGYDASIWYACSEDGETWTEKGEALERGEKGSWDEYSVFTPNMLKASGKYYLFYTGVKPTEGNAEGKFENNSINDITGIGIAVASHPDSSFNRIFSEPVLEVSENPGDFDSYRVDDACLIYKDKTYYLYYKGRSRKYGKEGPRHTKLGLALSDTPGGPYLKHKSNPLIHSGHEVMAWPYEGGIMSLVSGHGPEGKTLQYASDGIHFKIVASFGDDYPKAPGSYRIGDFTNASEQKEGISWGISMFYGNDEKWPHLLKYTLRIRN